MNSINSCHHINRNGLGSFLDIFSAGAGLVDSFVDARADRKSDESDERQLQLQLEAQREQAQMQDARLTKILKFAAIACGVVLTGGIIIAVVKSDSKPSDEKKSSGDLGKQKNVGRLQVLDGLKTKSGIKKKSSDRKAA